MVHSATDFAALQIAEASTNDKKITEAKITLTILIFIFGMSGVLTPRLFNPFGRKISYLNLIACGVITSTALIHLLSDG